MSLERLAVAPADALFVGPVLALRAPRPRWASARTGGMPSAAVALRAAEALLRELEAADRFSGVVGGEQGDQMLLLEAFGYASRAWSIPTTVDTRFDTASITKAAATLQLVEHGAFALETS